MDDPVRLEDVGLGHSGRAALAVRQHDLAADHARGQDAAVQGLEFGLAAALLALLNDPAPFPPTLVLVAIALALAAAPARPQDVTAPCSLCGDGSQPPVTQAKKVPNSSFSG